MKWRQAIIDLYGDANRALRNYRTLNGDRAYESLRKQLNGMAAELHIMKKDALADKRSLTITKIHGSDY